MKNKTLILLAALLIVGLALTAFSPLQTVAASALPGRGGPNGTGMSGQGYQGAGGTTGLGTGRVNASPQAARYGAGLGTGVSLVPLTEAEALGLQEAILEEYGAMNLYQAVIDQFGSELPFSAIVRSEQQHVSALIRQAEKYGVTVPENPGLVNPPVFASLTEACQAGVDAEIADAALYDELKLVTTHTDLLRVYDRLQSASLNQHLPAFEACN